MIENFKVIDKIVYVSTNDKLDVYYIFVLYILCSNGKIDTHILCRKHGPNIYMDEAQSEFIGERAG